jgi:hypothetical protein
VSTTRTFEIPAAAASPTSASRIDADGSTATTSRTRSASGKA